MIPRQKLIFFFSALFLWLETVLVLLLPACVVLLITYSIIALGLINGLIAKIFLIVSVLFSIGLTFYRFEKVPKPTAKTIHRRIEKTSGFFHRPLDLISDTPAKNLTPQLWNKAINSAQTQIRKSKLALPEPQLTQRDPFALRHFALLLSIVAIIIAGYEGLARLRDSMQLIENSFNQENKITEKIDLTITPPPYTGIATQTISDLEKFSETLKIPAGSKFEIHIGHSFFAPQIKINDDKITPEKIDQDAFIGKGNVFKSGTFYLSKWPFTHIQKKVEVTKDTAPSLFMDKPPQALPNGLTRLSLRLKDDYGVQALKVELLANRSHWLVPDKYVEYLPLLKAGHGAEETISPTFDFSWHPQVGQSFELRVTAIDDLGQSVTIAPVEYELPVRHFKNPLAKSIAKLRAELMAEAKVSTARRIANDLDLLLRYPDDFQGQIPAYIAVRMASTSLQTAYQPPQFADTAALMWQSALSLEGDATSSQALKNLKDAQRELSRLMNDPNATPEQLQQALENYQQALAQSLQSLFEQMQRQNSGNSALSRLAPEIFSDLTTSQTFDDVLRRMNEALQNGDKQKAAELFAQMQKMMDALSSGASGQMPEGAEDMAKAIEELQALIDRQQDLLIQTEKQITLLNDGKSIKTDKNAVEQNALRFILGQLMREMGENLPTIPENMAEAEQAMRSSATSLENNLPDISTPFQQKAIDELNKSQKSMQQQLKMALQNMMLLSPSGEPERDALGRETHNGHNSEKVTIPKENARRKIQAIIENLRAKAANRNLPKEERDYYLRLLQQF